MSISNQIALVFAVALSSMGIQSVSASTCSSDQCLPEKAVDLRHVEKNNVHDALDGMSALALLQVGQDLDQRSKDQNFKVHHHHSHKHTIHTGSKHRHGLKSHKDVQASWLKRHTAGSHQSQVPTGLLSIRSEPRDDAAFAGVLEKGATFKVSSAHEAPDGKVWLHLADGRGWVPKDHLAEIQQAPAEEAPKAEATPKKEAEEAPKAEATPKEEAEAPAEATPKKEAEAPAKEAPKKESPKRSQEEIREEYKRLSMKEADLHDQLEHNHGQTINADWRNEYPYKHDPNETPAQPVWYGTAVPQSFSFAIGLSILAALAA